MNESGHAYEVSVPLGGGEVRYDRCEGETFDDILTRYHAAGVPRVLVFHADNCPACPRAQRLARIVAYWGADALVLRTGRKQR